MVLCYRPSVLLAPAVIRVAVLSHLMILTEEEHLRHVFGEVYERYCERVPRYIPLPV